MSLTPLVARAGSFVQVFSSRVKSRRKYQGTSSGTPYRSIKAFCVFRLFGNCTINNAPTSRIEDWAINLLKSPTETLINLIPDIEPSLIYKKIREKLGWLVDYELDLNHWNQMVTLTRSLDR